MWPHLKIAHVWVIHPHTSDGPTSGAGPSHSRPDEHT